MILPESLRIGQGPSAPQQDALRATVMASTVSDSSPFQIWFQVYLQGTADASSPGERNAMVAWVATTSVMRSFRLARSFMWYRYRPKSSPSPTAKCVDGTVPTSHVL